MTAEGVDGVSEEGFAGACWPAGGRVPAAAGRRGRKKGRCPTSLFLVGVIAFGTLNKRLPLIYYLKIYV